jgi:hypothetical protein
LIRGQISCDFMKQMKKSKRSIVLTVNGKAVIVENAEVSQHLFDIAAHADVDEGIRQGLENAEEGKLRPARQFFDEFEAVQGISR